MKIAMKPLVVGGMIGTIGLTALGGGVSTVSAHSTDQKKSNLVEIIATKFNLNKDEVQEAFDEARETRREEFESKRAEKLQSLVDNGTITQKQKTAIEAKLAEMKSDREKHKDDHRKLSHSERKAEIKEKRAELKAWAKENNIPLKKLYGIFSELHMSRHTKPHTH